MKRIWPAILLAWIAGFVDALGYLALAKVFTAHMSGNSAAVGAELGSGNWHEAMVRGLVIPGFIFGVGVGTLVEILVRRRRMRARLAPAFVLEMALLVCFLMVEPISQPELHLSRKPDPLALIASNWNCRPACSPRPLRGFRVFASGADHLSPESRPEPAKRSWPHPAFAPHLSQSRSVALSPRKH